MLRNRHVRFGGRAAETHQPQDWQGAAVRPLHLRADLVADEVHRVCGCTPPETWADADLPPAGKRSTPDEDWEALGANVSRAMASASSLSVLARRRRLRRSAVRLAWTSQVS